MPKVLKKLGEKEKTRSAREKISGFAAFIAKGIKSSPQQLVPILLSLYQRTIKTSLEITIKI